MNYEELTQHARAVETELIELRNAVREYLSALDKRKLSATADRRHEWNEELRCMLSARGRLREMVM